MSENKYEVVKFIDDNIELDVNIDPYSETIWLTQSQMAILFGVDISRISRHIKNALNEEEINSQRNLRKTQIANSDKLVYLYDLDVIISVGYRVKSIKGVIFRKWGTKVLKEYLLQGYVINKERSLVTNENYVRLINKVESLDERVSNIENNYKPFEFKNSQLFFDGQLYDAYTLIQSLFESANNEIIIIDNYVDRTILDRLVVKKSNVKVIIYTSINTRLLGRDINTFNSQYGGLDVRYTTNVHDRYIIIDQNKIYHLGHSIKDLGKKIFSISESESKLIPKLLSNI
jgi:hypothetical protein